MTKRLPPLNALRAFAAVAQHLSVTKAAAELCVTHAAVSQQIKLLENYLNMKLLYRQGNNLSLTEQGKQYAAIVQSCFLQLQQATEHLLINSDPHVLTVYFPATLAMRWFIPRMKNFQELHPDITLRLLTGHDRQDFMQADADVAIVCTDESPKNYQNELLLPDYLLPVACPTIVVNRNKDDFANYYTNNKFIYVNAELRKNDWPEWLSSAKLAAPKKSSRIYFESTLQAIYAAINGVGILMAHELLAAEELKQKQLVKLSSIRVKTASNYYLIYPKGPAKQSKIKLFQRWLLQELR